MYRLCVGEPVKVVHQGTRTLRGFGCIEDFIADRSVIDETTRCVCVRGEIDAYSYDVVSPSEIEVMPGKGR